MNADDIRSETDRNMQSALAEHRDVIKANEFIERQAEEGKLSLRRRLLATSVRLSERMSPTVHGMVRDCVATLALDIPVELYVFASPQYNAACFKPEDGRLFVMFASSLLEAFADEELRFVVGHELGHHAYHHHDIPIGYLLKGKAKPDARLALDLFTWSRYAEISADRAGAHCTNDLDSVARALFKLASGLTGDTIDFNLDDFLKQVDEMQLNDAEPGQSAPMEDWFSTHPFSPLRVKALQLYDESVLAREDGTTKDELEMRVHALMSLMEPSYLEGRTETAEAMRRALFAGAIVVAAADGEISGAEIEMFEKFFGKGSYTDSLNVEQLAAELPSRLEQVLKLATLTQRMQLLRDLCVISLAEGHHDEAERERLDEVADGLDIPRSFVCRTIDGNVELD